MKRSIALYFFPAAMSVAIAAACAGDPPTVVQPQLLNGPSPFRYPTALWDQRVEGETVLLLHVGDRGQVDSTLIHASSGHGALDTAAIVGARSLRFTPGRRGDRYVGMWTRLPVRFAIDTAAAAAAGPTPAAAPDSASADTAVADSSTGQRNE